MFAVSVAWCRAASVVGLAETACWWGCIGLGGGYVPLSTGVPGDKPGDRVSRPAAPRAGRIEVIAPVPAPIPDEAAWSVTNIRCGTTVASANQATERRAE